MKKIIKKILFMGIIVLFLPLSYLKFFTMQISYNEDPTETIVKTNKVCLLQNFKRVNTSLSELDLYEGNNIEIINSDEGGNKWGTIYSFSIIAWWIIMIYLLMKLIKFINFSYLSIY